MSETYVLPEHLWAGIERDKAEYEQPSLPSLEGWLSRYLHLEPIDLMRLRVILAVAVSSSLEHETPTWVMNVGAPSAGKTELTKILAGVAEHVSDLTKPGLLTAKTVTRGRGVRETLRTGLLTRYDDRPGFVVISDFSSMLGSDSRSGQDRGELYACLREVYDGRWQREHAEGHVEWQGKMTFIANVTKAVDRFAAHAAALGDRWLYFRIPERSAEALAKVQELALTRDPEMAARAQGHAAADAASIILGAVVHPTPTSGVNEYITDAGVFTSFARATVPRDSYGKREIIGVVEREDSTRMSVQLSVLGRCLNAIGLDSVEVIGILRWMVMSAVPEARMLSLIVLHHSEGAVSLRELAARADLNRGVARRALQDLQAIGLVDGPGEESAEMGGEGWSLKPAWRERLGAVLDPDLEDLYLRSYAREPGSAS